MQLEGVWALNHAYYCQESQRMFYKRISTPSIKWPHSQSMILKLYTWSEGFRVLCGGIVIEKRLIYFTGITSLIINIQLMLYYTLRIFLTPPPFPPSPLPVAMMLGVELDVSLLLVSKISKGSAVSKDCLIDDFIGLLPALKLEHLDFLLLELLVVLEEAMDLV